MSVTVEPLVDALRDDALRAHEGLASGRGRTGGGVGMREQRLVRPDNGNVRACVSYASPAEPSKRSLPLSKKTPSMPSMPDATWRRADGAGGGDIC